MQHVPGLFVTDSSERGRGVFSSIALQPGDLIEICPLIVLTPKETRLIEKTSLYDYYFLWRPQESIGCLALGYGSLYNHSQVPNAVVILDYQDDTIKIECCLPIEPGDEIFIDYTDGDKDDTKLWFNPEEQSLD